MPKLHMACLASCSICASSTRYAPRDFISVATSYMMRVTGRCKSDLVTSPHQRVVGLGPRQQPTADTPGVAWHRLRVPTKASTLTALGCVGYAVRDSLPRLGLC